MSLIISLENTNKIEPPGERYLILVTHSLLILLLNYHAFECLPSAKQFSWCEGWKSESRGNKSLPSTNFLLLGSPGPATLATGQMSLVQWITEWITDLY